jgi:hypothetical protein
MRILRVFPVKTSMTPDDEYVRIGEPDLLPVPEVDEIHISCVFTWHKAYAELLAEVWAGRGIAPVRLGGPAFDDAAGDFVPGRYVRKGVTFTSRGCPNRCPFCYVPKREGALRLLPITDGTDIQDNNILACPEDHFAAVCEMLARQRRGARFVGGLDALALGPRHIKHMRKLKIKELWLACDHKNAITPLRAAVKLLRELPDVKRVKDPRHHKIRCYVLVGRGEETLCEAEERLEAVWDAGCMPYAQLFRDDEGPKRCGPQWDDLIRKWSRPALIITAHK